MFKIFHRLAGAAVAACLCLHAAAHNVDALEAAPTAPAAGAATEHLSGRVHHLTIDDRVAGVTVHVRSLQPDAGKAVALKGDQAAGLETGERVEAVGERNGTALFVRQVKRSGAAQAAPKASRYLRGRLALLHVDYMDERQSEFLFELHDDAGNAIPLHFPVMPEALQRNMQVEIAGRPAADGGIIPDSVTITALPAEPKAAVAKAVKSNNVLVILMTFTDSGAVPFTQAQVQNVFAGGAGTGSVAEFFKEASYGQQLLNATITPWLSTSAATPANCNFQSMGQLGRSAANAAGYTTSGFQNIVYLFPKATGCSWSGLGYVGASGAWINGYNLTSVYGHELGHNFGLLHAGSVRCSAGIIGGTCTVAEYGDPFGAMGNQSAMHYNASQKLTLGWISSSTVSTHTAGTVTYTLTPIETAGGATYAVKVPTGLANRTYWIEYRQPIGFDAALSSFPNNGAQIRVASPFETLCSTCDSGSNDTQLLDMTPATTTFNDATLVAGQTFTDSTYNVTVRAVSASSTALTVQVTSGTGGGGSSGTTPAATTTGIASSANPSTTGASVTFTATVNGAAPSGAVSFRDAGNAIAACSAIPLAGSGNTRTAACTISSLAVGTHAITAVYGGDSANAGSTSSAVSQVINSAVSAPSTNVALASNGGVASASTSYGPGYPVAGVNDGDRTGARLGSAVWADGTPYTYPDWVQINFSAAKTIDRVVVYSVADQFWVTTEPTDTDTATQYGLRDFTVEGWNGASWTTLATVTRNTLTKRAVTFAAYTTDRIRISITNAASGLSYLAELEAWTAAGGGTRTATTTSLASSANPANAGAAITLTATVTGAAPTGSVSFSDGGVAINGCSTVALAGSDGNARTATCSTGALSAGTHSMVATYAGDPSNSASTSSALLQVVNPAPAPTTTTLASSANPASAGASITFTATVTGSMPMGSVSFSDGSTVISACSAVALSGTGNARTATCSISSLAAGTHGITAAYAGNPSNAASTSSALSQVVNAVITAGPSVNVALASNGATATASSVYSAGGYAADSAINGERTGASLGANGAWADNTYGAYPDWLQVNFSGSKTIDRVVLYSLGDQFWAAVQPTDSTTFNYYGIRGFTVEGWNGSSWVTLATVTGNNLVKRTVTFNAFTTDRVRVSINDAAGGFSYVAELEAWTRASTLGTGAASPVARSGAAAAPVGTRRVH